MISLLPLLSKDAAMRKPALTTKVDLRIDVRLLARLLSYYQSNGISVVSRGEMIRSGINVLLHYLQKTEPDKLLEFTDSIQAKDYLVDYFGHRPIAEKRMEKKLKKQIDREIDEGTSNLPDSVMDNLESGPPDDATAIDNLFD